MLRLILVLGLFFLASEAARCHENHNAYPPPSNDTIPTYELNLDLPPKERWAHIVKGKKASINGLVNQIIKQLPKKLRPVVSKFLENHGKKALSHMPQDYAEELMGIAEASGVDLGYIVAMNLAYEITGVGCTSIVAQAKDGQIYHARNLDFGLFSGFDFKNDTWYLTEQLREMLFNLRVMKGGKLLYNSTTFTGFIGLLSGSNGRFSITVDSRFDDNLDYYLLRWLEGKWKGLELTQLTRRAIENNQTYEQATDYMQKADIMGPAYMIVGGTKPGQGSVITREPAKTVNFWTLDQQMKRGSFYVLETNYDHWKRPPFYDDRRDPAEKCMNMTGAAGMNKASLYDILSGKPNLNSLTTYTVVMHLSEGVYEGYKQRCPPPCSPW